MALIEGFDTEFLAAVLSDESVQAQLEAGNFSQAVADSVFAIHAASSAMTTEEVADVVTAVTASIQSGIEDSINNGIDPAFGVLDEITDKIKDILQDTLDPIFGLIERLTDAVSGAVGDTINAVQASVDSIGFKVASGVNTLLEQTREIAATLERNILDPIQATLQDALDLIRDITSRVQEVVADLVAPIKATTDTILDSVKGFASAIREALPEFGTQILEGLLPPIDLLTGGIKDAASSILSAFFGDIAEEAVTRIEPLIKMFEDELDVNPELRKITAPGVLPVAAIGGLMAGFALPMILSSVASTALSPFAEKMRQRMNSLVRPTLINGSDIIQAWQRDFADEGLKDAVLDRQGFPDDQQQVLIDLLKTRPGTMDIVDYWRRELFTDDEANTELRNLGWDDRYIAIIREAAFPPPGVQDLIRMAVREVFSPEVAEAFGQFEEIPPQYLIWAKRIGLSEEWARNYWAAHWVLPSVQQGFQMLHRQIITESDLERLFVALDVMPFWREPLKQIAFRPYTRVDVRRMFSLNILDRSGVLRAYTDLGFDDEKAENMTEFTVRWVESTRKVEKDRERDLTKGDIIGLFNDGLLTEAQARTHLESMGFDTNESQLLIQREILQDLRRDRKADITLVVDQAKIKVLTFEEAQDRLNGLDLTRKELEKALVDVRRATTERIRLPSKADLDNWRELQLISPEQYVRELDNLGFPAKYVALFSEAIQLEEAQDLLAAEERAAKAAEPRNIPKGQLDSLLRTDIIDIEGYRSGLAILRFSSTAIDDFTTQITIQIEERRLEDEARLARGEDAAEKEKLLGRVLLGKLLLKEIIDLDAYEEGLTQLGFSPESVALLVELIAGKLEEIKAEAEE